MVDENELEIYEKNLELIKEANPLLWISVRDELKDKEHVYVDLSVKSEPIVAIEMEEHIWYMNSRYDAQKAVDVWAGEKEDIKYSTPIIVFGFGNGLYVRKLRELYSENIILIYEPSVTLFDCVLKHIELSDILSDEKILISIGKNQKYLFDYISIFVDRLSFQNILWKVIPNYERLFPIEYLKMQKIYVERIQNLEVDKNTILCFQESFARNQLQNMWEGINSYSIDSLKKNLIENVDVEKYPAIIVAAGPSLDNNVQYLKDVKGKAYIIVVDTALKTVLRAGIKPDIAVTIDPNKPVSLFEDEKIKHLPMVLYTSSNKDVLKIHKGKKFFFGESGLYFIDICNKYKKQISDLEAGGSVSDIAFSFAKFIGFKKIILMGMDFGFPGEKIYTKEAYEKQRVMNWSSRRYFEIEDIYGEKIWSEMSMDKYRRWFERQIARYPELTVIDATEGGAKIRGTEIMTLKETIERECKELECIDFEQITETTIPIFSKTELEEIKQQLWDIPKELETIEDILDKGIAKYEKLKCLTENVSKNIKEIKKQIKKIEQTKEWLEDKSEMKLVNIYNAKDDYAIEEEIFDIQDEVQDEFTAISETGIKILNSYHKAIDKLKEDLHILYDSMQEDTKTEII